MATFFIKTSDKSDCDKRCKGVGKSLIQPFLTLEGSLEANHNKNIVFKKNVKFQSRFKNGSKLWDQQLVPVSSSDMTIKSIPTPTTVIQEKGF